MKIELFFLILIHSCTGLTQIAELDSLKIPLDVEIIDSDTIEVNGVEALNKLIYKNSYVKVYSLFESDKVYQVEDLILFTGIIKF